MGDLTQADVENSMRRVLADAEFMGRVESVVVAKMADKIDRTFGLDCTSHDDRERSRRNMAFLDGLREYAESEKGRKDIEALRRVVDLTDSDVEELKRITESMKTVRSNFLKSVLYLAGAGIAASAGFGVISHDGIKGLFK